MGMGKLSLLRARWTLNIGVREEGDGAGGEEGEGEEGGGMVISSSLLSLLWSRVG